MKGEYSRYVILSEAKDLRAENVVSQRGRSFASLRMTWRNYFVTFHYRPDRIPW